MVSRLTANLGVTILAGECRAILYLPQALEFCPLESVWSHMVRCYSRHSVLELSIRLPGALDGTRIRLQAGLPEHPQLPLAAMQAQSQTDVGPGWLMLGHVVLHVCPRKLLAASDTDDLVASNAQCKIQKNVAPRTGHRILWYADTHMHVCRCETHHKFLLMRFLQRIIKTELQEEGRTTWLGTRLL